MIINIQNLQSKMSYDLINQGVRRNTLSLEFELFWHLNPIENDMINPQKEYLNQHLHLYARENYTRWYWQNSIMRHVLLDVLVDASGDGCLEIVQFLISNTSILDFYETNPMKFNWALCYASKHGHLDVVKFIVESKIWDCDLDIALVYASQHGQLNVVQFLIKYGASDLDTALWYACGEGHLNVVKFLIHSGATDFHSAFCSAQGYNHQEIMDYLSPLMAS